MTKFFSFADMAEFMTIELLTFNGRKKRQSAFITLRIWRNWQTRQI